MATLTVTMPTGTTIVNGKQVTFRAPCDCTGIDGIVISGTTYMLVDATTEQITGHTFKKDAMVSVIMDTENNKAFVQNGIIYGVSTVELTRAEYEALVAAGTIDSNTIYVVTDNDEGENVVKVATGTYDGTGEYGSSNQNSLTFDFVPKLVIVGVIQNLDIVSPLVLIYGQTITRISSTDDGNNVTVSWSGNTVSWYVANGGSAYQFNNARTYHYVAIG